MKRKAIYLAHPLNAPTREGIEANRAAAGAWAAFLARHFNVAPECSWVTLTGQWEETEENRKLGIECDLALVGCCRELVMVGPRISSGMLIEATHAVTEVGMPVYNLTGLPMDPMVVAQAWEAARWFP